MPHDKPGRRPAQPRQHHNMDGLPIPQVWEDESAADLPDPVPGEARVTLWCVLAAAAIGALIGAPIGALIALAVVAFK